MTPLKFRAFNHDDNAMYLDVQNGCKSDAAREPLTFGEVIADEAEFTIMQSIGLRDKNGKEIFDGDILRDKQGDVAQVEWDDEKLCWRFNVLQLPAYFEVDRSDLEVIGNIYENPELLPKAA